MNGSCILRLVLRFETLIWFGSVRIDKNDEGNEGNRPRWCLTSQIGQDRSNKIGRLRYQLLELPNIYCYCYCVIGYWGIFAVLLLCIGVEVLGYWVAFFCPKILNFPQCRIRKFIKFSITLILF
jgi:hypothetical protein